MVKFKKIASMKTAEEFRSYLKNEGIELDFDDAIDVADSAPLKRTLEIDGKTVGNRLAILPMEGWDCPDQHPSELTRQRWKNFGTSGAKLIFGCEAAAVRRDGLSNPRQLMICDDTIADIADMRQMMVDAHKERFGTAEDLYVGLQLTHSGRFSRPNANPKDAKILYHHPILDAKFGLDESHPVLTDDEVEDIIADYVTGAKCAEEAGFEFVDVKHCHGYLGHEFLSAVDRPGKYGGSFENRTRFLREIVAGIRRDAPTMKIGVRLSLFDFVPFKMGPDKVGVPTEFDAPYKYAFGGDGTGLGIDLTETLKLLDLLDELGIRLVCATVGSPYYNPHIQRPAMFPPSDGYQPPEDPLKGVARQIKIVADLKKARPNMLFIGCGYSYLQEWLPNVAQFVVRNGLADSIGIGRMALPYADIWADTLEGKAIEKCRLCRTFSDCTTAPRNGLVSGCYPLDKRYKAMEEFEKLKAFKRKS